MAKRKGGLGRGLDALFADAAPLFEEEAEQNEDENSDDKLLDMIDDVTGDKARERFAVGHTKGSKHRGKGQENVSSAKEKKSEHSKVTQPIKASKASADKTLEDAIGKKSVTQILNLTRTSPERLLTKRSLRILLTPLRRTELFNH